MIDKTLCEHCVFKSMSGEKQSGCSLGRLNILPNHIDGNYYVVDTYCNACRNIYWEVDKKHLTTSEKMELVLNEIKTSFDVIVFCPSDSTEEEIDKSINSIRRSLYPIANAHIIMPNNELGNKVARKYQGIGSNFTFHLSHDMDRNVRIHGLLNKIKSPYMCFLALGEELNSSILESINHSNNVQMNPQLVVSSKSMYVCPTFLYTYYRYDENPLESINKYVESISKSNSNNSQS